MLRLWCNFTRDGMLFRLLLHTNFIFLFVFAYFLKTSVTRKATQLANIVLKMGWVCTFNTKAAFIIYNYILDSTCIWIDPLRYRRSAAVIENSLSLLIVSSNIVDSFENEIILERANKGNEKNVYPCVCSVKDHRRSQKNGKFGHGQGLEKDIELKKIKITKQLIWSENGWLAGFQEATLTLSYKNIIMGFLHSSLSPPSLSGWVPKSQFSLFWASFNTTTGYLTSSSFLLLLVHLLRKLKNMYDI